MGERWSWLAGLMLLASAIAAIGCGGGSGTDAESTNAGKQVFYPRVKGPARSFLVHGGDNVVMLFGEEATPAERERASHVVHQWMRARVARDWAEDCKYLARAAAEGLAQDAFRVSHGKAKTCPQALAFFGTTASGKLENTLTGPIDSLRVRESAVPNLIEAYALYHGRHGRDWDLPMVREGKIWRVSSASPIDREK